MNDTVTSVGLGAMVLGAFAVLLGWIVGKQQQRKDARLKKASLDDGSGVAAAKAKAEKAREVVQHYADDAAKDEAELARKRLGR
jgi:hypothetical protein